MSQISSSYAKLDLLKKTHDIEEKEREKQLRGVEKRKEKYNVIKRKNDNLSLKAANDLSHKQDEATQQDLIDKMNSHRNLNFLSPITNVLTNGQGIFFFTYTYTYTHTYLFIYIYIHIYIYILFSPFFEQEQLTKLRRWS